MFMSFIVFNMGLDSSKSNGDNSALPKSPYKPFHKDSQCYPAPLTIIRELRHFQEGDPPMDVSACAFPPNDDSALITLTTFPSVHRNFRAGYVQSWDLHDDGDNEVESCNDSLFTYAPRPALSFSSEGDLVSVILNSGKGQLILVEKFKDNSLEPCKVDCKAGEGLGLVGTDTSLCSRALCCVFSSDGSKVVTVTNATLQMYRPGRETHELCLWKVCAERTFQCIWRVSCEVILPKFSGCLVSCVFSPDSTLLSLSTSFGQLYVVHTETLEMFAAIKTEITLETKCISSFNPCVANEQLAAICCRVGRFQVWKLATSGVRCITDAQITGNLCKVNAFNYSLDGSLLAFGKSDGKVLVYESEPLQVLYELDPFQHAGVESNVTEAVSIYSLAFSTSCQELAVGYSDNCIRLWQLPIKMDLRHMCRLAILKIVPAHKLYCLPLPKCVIAYLLFTYITLDDE